MADTEIKVNYTGVERAAQKLRSLGSSLMPSQSTGSHTGYSSGQTSEALREALLTLDATKRQVARMADAAASALSGVSSTFQETEHNLSNKLKG